MFKPPSFPVKPIIDNYHGTTIEDPYRYLEDLNSPEVKALIEQQAKYADNFLSQIPERAEFWSRIVELEKATAAQIRNIIRLENSRVFYLKRQADDETWKLYGRKDLGSSEFLLVDPDCLSQPDKHYSIGYYQPSWDGEYVFYGMVENDSDNTQLYIMENF